MNLLERAARIWRRLPPRQRGLFALGGVGFLVLFIAVLTWAMRPEYGVLYSNLDPADAGTIIDRLKSDNVSYQLRDDGRTVLVPAKSVHELRLNMAGAGLPSSGTGYEILDNSKLGWTDLVQKVQNRRALEGEIARTIQTLHEIQSARVHLAIPEPTLFASQEKPTTASVVLQLKPGARLNPGQVRGIVHLVSSSVEGLLTENVTLLDSQGTLLSSPAADPLAGGTSDQLGIVRDVEDTLTQKVETLLDTVLGPGKSVVRIAVKMDFEHTETTLESFDADNPVVRSEQKSAVTDPDGNKTETGTTNYEISKRVERKTGPPGVIDRLTASVFVDGTYQTADDGTQTYVPRSTEEMAKFENIIKTALGFDAKRGDQLTVENIAFDNSAQQTEREEQVKDRKMEMLLQVGGRVGSVVVAVLVLFLFLRALRRSSVFASGSSSVALESGGRSLDRATHVLDRPESTEADRIRQRVLQLGREKPEEVSRLLRAWLREDAS